MSSYDDEGAFYPVEERTGNPLVLAGLIVAALVVLFFLWRLCFTEEETSKPQPNTPQPVFAHEIRPGFVVLQSQDGQFFRVLQEYSEVKWNRRSGESHGARPNECATWRPIEEVESVIYTPQYTSAQYQTQPSAPRQQDVGKLPYPMTPAPASGDSDANNFLLQLNNSVEVSPPPYRQ